MTEQNLELEQRWSEWLLQQNQRGMRSVLWIVVCLYPSFGVLDYLVAPSRWLVPLYATRAIVTLVTLILFRVVASASFARHPNAISASYTVLISGGIILMTMFMGGLASPYYAGLSLVIVASGLLFVWPPAVIATTYAAIVLGFLIANLLLNGLPQMLTAVSNQFFLISTAIIAGTGQIVRYRSQREQIQNQLTLAKTTEHLAHAHQQLKQLDRFKSELFANITHELKTPLTLILAPLGLLVDGELGFISEAQRSSLTQMQKSGFKLSRLIADLLDLSKLEESRLRLRIEEHDLVAYLRGLLGQIEPLTRRKAIQLTLEAEDARALVWCDIERLERVFINLLSNATKFTEVGGAVRVRVRDEGESVCVEVEDSGLGFPSSMSQDVFKRFFQADMAGTRRFGGTGIGLALARELVALHGGQIWAESEPGQGARFSVRLLKDREHFPAEVLDRRGPMVDRLDGQRETDGSLLEWSLDAPSHLRLLDIDEATEQRQVERDADEDEREHTLLVVEDTPDVARVIRLALHHDFRLLVAGNGQQGLEMARSLRPTIIVTDWMMPKLDGLEMTRQLRLDPRTRQIPIVMLTARSDVEHKVVGLESGVDAFVGKPFATKELVSTIRGLLRGQALAADALLNQKMDSLETIAGGLAHEINNPLNYLKNALASVERDCSTLVETFKANMHDAPDSRTVQKLDLRMRKMLDVSRAGVTRITNTVELMVRYSREGYDRSPRLYDAFAAARDVILVVVPTVPRQVKVSIQLPEDGWITCVPEEFNQVLTNLIQNALEAVAADGTGTVSIEGRTEASEIVLSVKDNGPGIPHADRARVFDAFYTTKPVGHGMGLGLTITRRVIVAMGGTLSFSTQLGSGSEFVIRVPRAMALEAAG